MKPEEIYEKLSSEDTQTAQQMQEVNDYLSNLSVCDLDDVVKAYKLFEADVSTVKQQIKLLKDIEDNLTVLMDKIGSSISDAMKRNSLTTCNVTDYRCDIRESKATEIYDESMIPHMYIKTKTTETVNKAAILEALKNNAEIPGARLVTTSKLSVRDN